MALGNSTCLDRVPIEVYPGLRIFKECPVKGFQRRLTEVVMGIICGVIQTIFIESFEQDGLRPSYISWAFVVIGIVANVGTINSLKVAGVTYALGWLVGSWLLRNMLGPLDLAINVAVPILLLVLKSWYWIKRAMGN